MAEPGALGLATNGFLAGKTCLVLDDEFLIALDIQQILENAGAARVVSVSNATDALEALGREIRFDVAVLDVKLSGGAGSSMSVAAALTRREIPFVFLTGLRADEVHAQSFPDAPVVEKPYQAPLLLAALRRLLPPEAGSAPRGGA